MPFLFLLVSGSKGNNFKKVLEKVLAPLGRLNVAETDDAIAHSVDGNYGIVIVDATVIDEVELLVSRLRARRPACRIVVMTASPTWRRARAAFEAGAIDYLPKTLSEDELLKTFRQILAMPLPPWPR